MKKLLEVANIDYVGEVDYLVAGKETKFRTAVLEELDTDRWNSLAERTNTKTFIRMTGKHPVNYLEVKAWVKGLILDTEKAPTGIGASNATSIA